MIRRVPIAAYPIPLRSVLAFYSGAGDAAANREALEEAFRRLTGKKHVFFLNSALACFYLALEALKSGSYKKDVIMPAYTADCLVVAIRRAGLRPRLCDISLEDFNMDPRSLTREIAGDALCILGVHSFGIVDTGLGEIKKRFPDIPLIEDCAQAFGSRVLRSSVGTVGDVSFFSFNKGKNFPTYGGGCVATDSDRIANLLELAVGRMGKRGAADDIKSAFRMLALSAAVNPWIYGAFYPLISGLKGSLPGGDFPVERYTDHQVASALSLLESADDMSGRRYTNGMKLVNEFKRMEGMIVPRIPEGTRPAFNRLPVLFQSLERRDKAERSLWGEGIETSRMYVRPLHRIFDLGYGEDDFPNANYFAERLITLPTHPLLSVKDIDRMTRAIWRLPF
jgi:dTDP-4-amino-4,6-dideoxygalactose transaminase